MTTSTINLLTDGNFDGVSLAPGAPGYNQGSPDGAFNGLVPFGWTGTTGNVGTFAPTAATSPGFVGSQVAYLNPNGAISQSFATPAVGAAGFDQYVISLDVGIRLQGAPTSGSLTITAKVGATVVGSTSVSVSSLTDGAATPLSFTTEDLYRLALPGSPSR